MTARQPLWIIEHDGQGSGGFLSPPGHPAHDYKLIAYWGGVRKPKSGPDFIGDIEYALEHDDVPENIRAQARRILEKSQLACSEEWQSQVYGYFNNSYSPDGTDRNVSNAVFWSPTCQICGKSEEKCSGKPGTPGWHPFSHQPVPPAEHHLGYLTVKKYFPDHQPRTDLIASGGGYGTRECIKCHERVQYEARVDGWAKVKSGTRWTYEAKCPQGGTHEVRPHNGECQNCGCDRSQS